MSVPMSAPDPYVYKPLDDAHSQIRLLRLSFDVKVAARHANYGPLKGSLKTYYLPKSSLTRTQRFARSAILPVFYALSYCWGDATRTREILVGGTSLPITESLYLALRDIQRQSIGDVNIWADAVCINQNDAAERSAQIPLMREIYHSASSVQIWLGATTADGKRCLKFIANLAGDLYEEGEVDEESEERILRAILAPGSAVASGLEKLSQGIFAVVDIVDPKARDEKATIHPNSADDGKNIAKLTKWRPSSGRLKKVQAEDFAQMAASIDLVFLQRASWFERMWTTQELGVADNAQVIYDGTSVSWEHFLYVTFYLHFTCGYLLPNIDKLLAMEKIRLRWTDSKRLSLFDLLRECRQRKATDAKDKIYALIGLMGDQLNPLLRPDYTKSVGEVYALTTQHFITQSGLLDPICGWQFDNCHDFPSWVPDFSLDQRRAPAPLAAAYGEEPSFSASGADYEGKYNTETLSASNWGLLEIDVLCLGSIATVSPSASHDVSFASIGQSWNQTMNEHKHLCQGNADELESTICQIEFILINYSMYYERAKPKRRAAPSSNAAQPTNLKDAISQVSSLEMQEFAFFNESFAEMYMHSLLCGRGVAGSRLTTEDVKLLASLKLPDDPIDAHDDPIFSIGQAFEKGVRNRNLAITKDGQVCIVPQHARQDDVVCVLHGCSVPVVLRQCGESNSEPACYSFVGECYVYGYMDGEAIVKEIQGEMPRQSAILI